MRTQTLENQESTPIARRIYDGEWDAAVRLTRERTYPQFTPDQLRQIRAQMAELMRWRRDHIQLHNFIGASALLFLFAADGASIVAWPFRGLSIAWQLGLGVVAGAIHGYIAYSITTFSLHEGAAHQAIIFARGPVSRFLARLANNASRMFFSDPVFYEENHTLHHQKFATREDGAFSNYVFSKRIVGSLAPLAMLFNMTDYKIHSGLAYTASRLLSGALGILYIAIYLCLAGEKIGWIYAVLALVCIGPWVGFSLDRLRESSEHTLMPLDKLHGARNLGTGFWALLIGGGPWGQPCHLSHHLGPGLSWYHQLALHHHLNRIFTEEQREFYFLKGGLLGFPRFFIRQLRLLKSSEV